MSSMDVPGLDKRENTPWLDRYHHLFTQGMHVLDLGCGTGDDSRELAALGCSVIALDLDPDRVRLVPWLPACHRIAGDITGGLPFQPAVFDRVVASLSLHYFASEATARAVADIARTLCPGGWLLCRVNAVGDTNFGYASGLEVEPSLFRQPEGHLKRFFDEPMLCRFLEPYFRLEPIVRRTILQAGIEKRTLECLAQQHSTVEVVGNR